MIEATVASAAVETRAGACTRCGSDAVQIPNRLTIEKPFAQCNGCGAFVARHNANEWDLLRPDAKAGLLARYVTRVFLSGVFPALVYAVVALLAHGDWRLRDALLFLGVGWLLSGAWEFWRLHSLIQRSRRRMSDPMYRARLVEFELSVLAERRSA